MQEVIECGWNVHNAPSPHLNLNTDGEADDGSVHYHQALQLVQDISVIKQSA